VSVKKGLAAARAGAYAVPLFDAFEPHAADGMIRAAVERRAPVIVGIYAGLVTSPGAKPLAAFIRAMAGDSPVPVSLMLDHGSDYGQCARALDLGFTDVMFDGSKLSLEENIAATRRVVEAARGAGAAVEAELGHVGSGDEYGEFGGLGRGFTDPDAAALFVRETGADFLAVAVGTAHGLYKGEPRLDLELLREIRSRVEVPLVLHGGTGLNETQFRTAIAGGIAKINVATDLIMAASAGMVEAATAAHASCFSIMEAAVEAYRGRCAYYIDLFGAAGRA
jgi:ketose-bisphosphate aldolase